jgi:hypothetical protein
VVRFQPLLRFLKFTLCILFLLGAAFACYRRPVPDDFDRYIYEAIVRGRSQPIEVVYRLVKHENPRAEASTVLDSPQHLRELEPLYAIRPIYLEAISLLSGFLPFQSAINLISAASLFGIGVVVLGWTKKPVPSALLLAAYPVLILGRLGTPDALASLLAISGLWLIDRENQSIFGLSLLLASLGVRTDNVLLILAVVAWLVWEKRMAAYLGGLFAALAIAIVIAINHWLGSYGWVVLFRFSFIGSPYPAQVPHTLTVREYLTVLVSGAAAIFPRVSIWLLLGILAWWRGRSPLLLVTGAAVAAHFLLYPSPEDRYLTWAYIVSGVTLMRSFEDYAAGDSGTPRPLQPAG